NSVPSSFGRFLPFPLTKMGAPSRPRLPTRLSASYDARQATCRFDTLAGVICASVENWVAARSPRGHNQSLPAGVSPVGRNVATLSAAGDTLGCFVALRDADANAT